jgi:hypothetical protein
LLLHPLGGIGVKLHDARGADRFLGGVDVARCSDGIADLDVGGLDLLRRIAATCLVMRVLALKWTVYVSPISVLMV